MKIDGMNPGQTAQMLKTQKAPQEEIPADSDITEVVEETEPQTEAKGVLELLQAGHFKGVSDVRLRINFHEELQALEAQNLQETASSSFEGFNQSVLKQVTILNESGSLDENQATALDSFLENVQSAQDEFMESENGSVESLLASLQNELDSLLGLLNPPAPEPESQAQTPIEDVVLEEEIPELAASENPEEIIPEEVAPVEETAPQAVEPEPEPLAEEPVEEPDPLLGLVQSFQESIQGLIHNLQSDLTNTSVLPDISEPSGNGKAYAKFMAIYESMLAGQETVESDEQLDIQEPAVTDEGEPDTEPTE